MFSKFRDSIEDSIMSFIEDNGLSFKQNILSLVRMESAYTNTEHDEFITKRYVQFHLRFNQTIHLTISNQFPIFNSSSFIN